MDAGMTGQLIASLRKKKAMTQQELADVLGVSNKTISKWENGKGMPDISVLPLLSDTLGVSIDELIRGCKYEGRNSAPAIVTFIRKKKNRFISYVKNADRRIRTGWVSGFFCIALIGLQAAFLYLYFKFGLEYLYDWMAGLVNQLIIIFALIGVILTMNKSRLRNLVAVSAAIILTIANIGLLLGSGTFDRTTVVSRSGSGNIVIIKCDRETGRADVFRSELLLFCRRKEPLPYTVSSTVLKRQWLTQDSCAVTYESADDGNVHQYIATFGDRGDGIGFYHVTGILATGTWMTDDVGSVWEFASTDEGFVIRQGKTEEHYTYEDCVQFGTIAVALCHDGIPKWTVVLNEDCQEEGGALKGSGSITICKVSMEKTAPVVFQGHAEYEE